MNMDRNTVRGFDGRRLRLLRRNPSRRGEALVRTRTGDPFLTMEVLYQLSYEGAPSSVARVQRGVVAGAGFEPA